MASKIGRNKDCKPLFEDYDIQKNAYPALRKLESIEKIKNNKKWKYDTVEDEMWIRKFPKVELHVHLDGSFSPSTLKAHLEKTGDYTCLPEDTKLPWDPQSSFPIRKMVEECSNDEDFHALCTCRGKQSLHAMIQAFEVFIPIVRGKLELIEQLAYDFVKTQANQNIIYTEVRYSPHLLAPGGTLNNGNNSKKPLVAVNADPVVDAVTRGLRRGQTDFPSILVNQILCCITWRPDWADDVVRMAKVRRADEPCAVVGIDIAAGEEHFDSELYPELYSPHWSAFQKIRNDDDLNVTLHAGEVSVDSGDGRKNNKNSGIINVKRAVTEYGATRIGHGYQICHDVSFMNEMKKQNIHFETCPTSSVETGGWNFNIDHHHITDSQNTCHRTGNKRPQPKNWKCHPSVTMIQNGLSVGINSDDPSVFDTSLTWQWRICLGKMRLTKAMLVKSAFDSIEASFCQDSVKNDLKQKIYDFLEAYKDK